MNLSHEVWCAEIARIAANYSPRYAVNFDDPCLLAAYSQKRSPEWAFHNLVMIDIGA